jgi:GTP cyclohydrolase II
MRQTLSRFPAPVYVQAMNENKPRLRASPAADAALVPPSHRVERAAGDFRRGVPVLIAAVGQSAIAVPAETVGDETLAAFARLAAPLGPMALVLTHARAATLKIRLYTPEVVMIPLDGKMKAEDLRAVADPASDLDYPLKGPFEASRTPPPQAAVAAVRLAKLAGLLPAAAIRSLSDRASERWRAESALSAVEARDILSYDARAADELGLVARARVPLENAEHAELAAFRPKNGGQEHYAVIVGAPEAPALRPPGPVLVRVHSECFTGDLLGSLKCDCGDQLRGAIKAIAEAGGGILLYLAQEGRGIGLMNKLRTYRLQDDGFDTMQANRRLGFAPDERLYDIAARMLQALGYSSVRLLTNNPDKMRALEAAGIEVAERVPHAFPENIHNRAYLRAKAEKGGHLL